MTSTPRRPVTENERAARQDPLLPSAVPHGRSAPHGPARRFDRRHFARLESGGALALAVIVVVALYFVGVDIGLLPDLFHWRR